MSREEFEEMVGESVTSETYKVIEYVYTWHPSISETEGKKQIKHLYEEFGMALIVGMVDIAEKMEKLEKARNSLRIQIQGIEKRMDLLRNGCMCVEDFADDSHGKDGKDDE